MAAKVVKKATTNLTCPICYQLFKNPKYLPCYHSYCEECLEKIAVHSKIICPECRQEAKIPAGGVKELANNFFISRMVDELVLQRKVEGEEEVKCDECDEDEPVVSFCPQCNMFLCQVCNDSHKRSKRFHGHVVVPLTELRTKTDTPLQASMKVPLCKEHDEKLKYYCETCEQLVCLYCTVKDHNGHNHDTVKKMVGKHRQELKEVTAPIEEMIKSLFEAHDNIEKVKVQIRQQGDEVNDKIDQYFDGLVQKLLEQKEKLKQQVNDTVLQKEKAATTEQEELELTLAEIVSMKELKDALEKSSDQEALSAKKHLVNHMQQLIDKYKKLNTRTNQSATMEIVSNKVCFPRLVQLYAHVNPAACKVANIPKMIASGKMVEFTITTMYCTNKPCSTGGSQVFVQVQFSTGEVTSAQVRDNNDGSYTASFVAQRTGEVKLSVNINGKWIKERPYSIMVLYDYAVKKPIKVINNSGNMGKPWGIAFGKEGMWAVADSSNDCVYIFNAFDQLIRTLYNLRGPKGVAFCIGNSIYVSESEGHRVKKFDSNGKCLLQFGSHGQDKGQLSYPYGLTVYNHKLYVAEDSNYRVSVFHTDGKFFQTIGNKDQLIHPVRDIAVYDDKLFVATYSHVHIFSIDGNYLKNIVKDQLSTSRSVDVHVHGVLLVADYSNHCITLFDKTGKLLGLIGSKGSKSGRFDCPTYVAISPDGKLYVSDGNNKRLQIFSLNL